MIYPGRAGAYTTYGGMRCFAPKPLPPDPPLEMDEEMLEALSSADRALARLDGATTTLPDPDLFVYAFMRQEAVLSSQIEGTQASLDDLFEYEAASEAAQADYDVLEVINYLNAINWGLSELPRLPLSLRLIKEIHRRLLQGVRGTERSPGTFRENQNWIGPPGCNLDNAIFVPPAVPLMGPALNDWEAYLHTASRTPILIKSALIHAQFETIHPFWDGNGPLGRMIVTLFLCSEGVLTHPVLYLSLFFKKNRDAYYNLLQRVRDEGDWESWVIFFLRGVYSTSQIAYKTAFRILTLRDNIAKDAAENFPSGKASILAENLFRNPYLTIKRVTQILDVSFPTASKLVATFEEHGYLHNLRAAKRQRIFAFRPYLDILHESIDDLTGVIPGEDHLVTNSG